MTATDVEARLNALEARVREAEDEREIRELIASYGHVADMGSTEGYVNLYTDDGVYEIPALKGMIYTEPTRFEGRDELRAFIDDPAGHGAMLDRRCQHFQGINCVIRIDGDVALAESYSILMVRTEHDSSEVFSNNLCSWILHRTPDGWRIKQRRAMPPGDHDAFHLLVPRKAHPQ